jgi:hypothetical protein
MFESLDALIATVAVILGLSLIVQAIQQIIKQVLDLKTGYMRDELVSMFADNWTKATGSNPVSSLKDASREQIGKLIGKLEDRMKGIGFKDLELLESVDGAKLKEIFKSIPIDDALNAVGGKVLLLRQEIELEIDRWFDLAKQAFQDHYERRMKVWAFGISAAVVIAMNINLFDTYTLFSTNSSAKEAGLTLAASLGKVSADSIAKIMRIDTTKAKSDSLTMYAIREKTRFVEKLVENKTFQFFGWQGAAMERLRSRSTCENVFIIPLGWLAMTLLVSLGAPFWYDLLKSLMGVKNMLKNKNDSPSDGGSATPKAKK